MRVIYTLLIALGALVLIAGDASAQEKSATLRLPVRADSRVWLEGSSNVRDWTCKATAMEALIAVDAASVGSRDNAAIAKSLRGVDVIIPKSARNGADCAAHSCDAKTVRGSTAVAQGGRQ